jgi:hypothetical protein
LRDVVGAVFCPCISPCLADIGPCAQALPKGNFSRLSFVAIGSGTALIFLICYCFATNVRPAR